MTRSILVVIAGYAVMELILRGAGYVLQAIEPGWFLIGTPLTPGYLGVTLAYRVLAAMVAGYLVASLAKQAHLKHLCVLAALICLIAMLSTFGTEDDRPIWYRLALVLVIPGIAIVGGRMRKAPALQAESQQNVAGDAAAGRVS